MIAAFLDINSAYDNVDISVLEHKLNRLNVPPNLIMLIIII